MPFTFNKMDCSPLVIDQEFDINDETLLAEYVGKIVLGHYAHVKRIIDALASNPIALDSSEIDLAINKLSKKDKTENDIEKRDGWVFQIISWLALYHENLGKNFYCQRPHDATAQHGLDGIALTLNHKLEIESIIITEDKCTIKHRTIIPKVWDEFKLFEQGNFNNKIVSRVSEMIENINMGNVLETNRNNIYDKSLWRYRVGINRNDTYKEPSKRKKLFKGYDGCITGDDPHRRYASTLHQDDIRGWMEDFCKKIISYLETQK